MPKPNAQIYPDMLAQFGIEAGRSAFFEDMARNLTPARALGMTTVLLREPDTPDYGGPVGDEDPLTPGWSRGVQNAARAFFILGYSLYTCI